MFQTLAIPSHTQSFQFTNRNAHRSFAVRCTAPNPNEFAGYLTTSRNSTPASLYEILKVKQSASPADIKSAYRNLAKIYHPDANPPEFDSSDFIRIHNAYDTLSDPKARAIYDRSICLVGKRIALARSVASTTSFGYHAPSVSSCLGPRPGFYPTRRWESDQCW